MPKVNPEVWGKLKRDTKTRDLKLQRIQNLVHKGLIPLIKLMENIKKDKANMRLAADAFRLLAMGSSQLSQRRRDLIAPDLCPTFRPLCGPNNPVTQLLFGDDLPKQIKDIADTQRVGAKFSALHKDRPGSGKYKSSFKYKGDGGKYRPKPYPYKSSEKKSFLDKNWKKKGKHS